MLPDATKTSCIDPVKLDAVIPQDFLAAIWRHLLVEKLLGCFRKVGVAVRIVGGKNQVIITDQLYNVADIGFVAFAADNAGAQPQLHSRKATLSLGKRSRTPPKIISTIVTI